MGGILLGAGILIIIISLIPIIPNKLYSGRIRCIKIVNKRTTTREMLNFSYTRFNSSNYATFEHKTVDFVYNGKKIIHTLNCYDEVFSKLNKGMVYDVVIRFNTIVKIKRKY